jgi:hypothetical protein
MPKRSSRTSLLPNNPRLRGGFGHSAISHLHRRARPLRLHHHRPLRLASLLGASVFWSSAMSIPDHISTNFETLLRAASNGNLALMECIDAITGEPRYVICASGMRARTTSSRHLDISRTAIPTTPICRQPKPRPDNRQPDPSAKNRIWTRRSRVNGQAVPASPSAMRDTRNLNRVFRPLHRNGKIRRR